MSTSTTMTTLPTPGTPGISGGQAPCLSDGNKVTLLTLGTPETAMGQVPFKSSGYKGRLSTSGTPGTSSGHGPFPSPGYNRTSPQRSPGTSTGYVPYPQSWMKGTVPGTADRQPSSSHTTWNRYTTNHIEEESRLPGPISGSGISPVFTRPVFTSNTVQSLAGVHSYTTMSSPGLVHSPYVSYLLNAA